MRLFSPLYCEIALIIFFFFFLKIVLLAFSYSYFCGQIGDDDRQLLFLYEHGKKKLMEGNRVAFKGLFVFYILFLFFSSLKWLGLLRLVWVFSFQFFLSLHYVWIDPNWLVESWSYMIYVKNDGRKHLPFPFQKVSFAKSFLFSFNFFIQYCLMYFRLPW